MRKNWTKMRRDRRADIGIGTMIVFIAMVLVAAVAAAVLISTANQVREQATSTGDQAINNVASGFIHQDVVGTTIGGLITTIKIDLTLAAGSPPVDLEHAVVVWTFAGVSDTLSYGAADTNALYFADHLREVSEYAFPLIGQGGMFTITIQHSALAHISVGALKHVVIQVIPAMGQSCIIDFMTPEILPLAASLTLA